MLGTREKREAVLTAFDGPLGHLEDHGGTVGLCRMDGSGGVYQASKGQDGQSRQEEFSSRSKELT